MRDAHLIKKLLFFPHLRGCSMNFQRLALGATCLILAVCTDSAFAQTDYYWDTDGNIAGFGTASGTWSAPTPGGTVGWSTDAAGSSLIGSVTTTTADTVIFGTDSAGLASGTITLSGTVSAANLSFGKASGDITLSGGSISLASGTSVVGALTSSGSVSNTHTIDSNIAKSAGLLRFGRQNTANENYVVNGIMSGGFGLDSRMQNGTAVLELNGLNSFTGNASIVTGQLNANSLANSSSASAIGAGNSVSLGGGGGQQARLVYTGAGATTTNRTFSINTASGGSGAFIAKNGAIDFTGTVRAQGSNTDNLLVLTGTADTGINTISGSITNGSSSGGELDVKIQSLGAVGVAGEAGNWIFSGVNTYTGTTTIQNSSTLQLGDGSATGSLSTSSVITVDAGSTFVVNQSDTVSQGTDFTSALSGAGDVAMAGSGALELVLKSGGHTGSTSVNNGTLRLVNSADLAGFSSKNININNGSTLEIFSNVGGPNRTAFLNGSTFTFGSNGGGTIVFDKGNHLKQGGTNGRFVTTGGSQNTITTNGGGFINPQNTNTIIFDVADGTDDVDLVVRVQANSGNLLKDGAGTVSYTNSSTLGGGGNLGLITINDGTFDIGGNAQLKTSGEVAGVLRASIANNGVFSHSSTQAQTVSGEISGAGAVVMSGTNTLTVSGTNTYSGTTDVFAGNMLINGDNSSALGNVTVANGATLGGIGTVGGVTVVNAGANLAPGASIGELTINNNVDLDGNLNIEIDGSSVDLLTIVGDLDIDSGAFLNFTVIGAQPDLNEYVFATYTGTRTGAFANIVGAPAGYSVQYDVGGSGNIALVNAVPEPATAMLLCFGLGVGILRRRRNN